MTTSKSFCSLSEHEDRPLTSSSSSNTSEVAVTKNFLRKSLDETASLRYFYPAQSESSIVSSSTADETASQISQMRDSINQTISRTKSFEMLKDESERKSSSPLHPRPRSLFCNTSTPVRSHESIPEHELAPNVPPSPEESDPTLNAVKKAMQRSDFLQRLDK